MELYNMHSFCVWHLLLSTTFWFFQCCFMYQSLISFGWFSVVLIGPKKVDWIHWLNEWVFSIVSIPSSTILLHFFCHAAAAANSLQLCPTLCDPMGFTVHGILQARILEWVAISFSIFYHEDARISSRLCVLLNLNLCIDYVKVWFNSEKCTGF